MARCNICSSCLTILRYEQPEISTNYWYCDFCDKVLDLSNAEIEIVDEEIKNKIREAYKIKHGYI